MFQSQVHLYEWGSNRYAANFAFICIQAYSAGLGNEDFLDFAKEQIGYILGDGGRSFVVGFGENYPTRPHHKASACPSPPTACTWETFSAGGPNPHLLLGALVGGPRKADDVYEDDRSDYISNEVSLDYNAGFQGAVAGLFQIAFGL
ncbi:uncharacterized protein LOC111702374 isoform X2 [Eurytemora carolleeae]|uniref:uncharacterized protein LOC111702374 isoform X2 n=1 Tax=Eurytemora carolleeae TaxID=1294199 RepID=UPI000C7731A1|nr:uncharacterized protein LOC111702374 isoform X2 [Eurytemora carolleeae]|eukprot:XP_023329807.1 uncharacterized protein LOC111702374 isoform X2 [Eurytemora affinis]